jgi:hypothetical protein
MRSVLHSLSSHAAAVSCRRSIPAHRTFLLAGLLFSPPRKSRVSALLSRTYDTSPVPDEPGEQSRDKNRAMRGGSRRLRANCPVAHAKERGASRRRRPPYSR